MRTANKGSIFTESKKIGANMLIRVILVLILVAAYTNAFSNLRKIQAPMPGVNAHQLTGQWFSTFRKPPCSYQGSQEFVNTNQYYSYEGKDAITVRLTWGTKYCNSVFGKVVFTSTPGIYLFKDTYGNGLSSTMVVIGTDYKTFFMDWGCTKFSVFGDVCEDPYIFVNTRTPRPSKLTIGRINTVLMERFGMTIKDLDKVWHDGACFAGVGKI